MNIPTIEIFRTTDNLSDEQLDFLSKIEAIAQKKGCECNGVRLFPDDYGCNGGFYIAGSGSCHVSGHWSGLNKILVRGQTYRQVIADFRRRIIQPDGRQMAGLKRRKVQRSVTTPRHCASCKCEDTDS